MNVCALEVRYKHTWCVCLQDLNVKYSKCIEIVDLK
jgi:hypothetical protein